MSEVTVAVPPVERRSFLRRWIPRAAGLLLGVTIAASLALTLLPTVGFRPMVVRSGSMAPAIRTGDLIVIGEVSPSQVAPGDVVTFNAPSGDGLVTHRVMEVEREEGAFVFVTKGDANSSDEKWTTDDAAWLGRVVVTLPKAGYAAAALAQPRVRGALLVGGALILGALALLRIWRR